MPKPSRTMYSMKEINYQSPQVREIELDLENFLCTSIQTLTFQTEVDEYEDMEDELYLD